MRESPTVCVIGFICEEKLPETLIVSEVESGDDLDEIGIVSGEHQILETTIIPRDSCIKSINPIGENIIICNAVECHIIGEQIGSNVIHEADIFPEL